MKLDAWLRQDHALADRLLLVERLSEALNQAHQRGEPLAALQPDAIEVTGDGRCDLAGARSGSPAAGYAAPERADGSAASPEADIYAAGAVSWEVLAGRPCGPSPEHLSEACPELPQELADAVMACLERSPQWRPRDLTYLAQLAQTARGSRRGTTAASPSTPPSPARPARSATARGGARASRGGDGYDSAARLRLAIGGVLVLGVLGGTAYVWSTRSTERAPSAAPATTAPAGPTAANALAPTALPTQSPEPAAPQPAQARPDVATPAASQPQATTPAPADVALPTPSPRAAAASAPVETAPHAPAPAAAAAEPTTTTASTAQPAPPATTATAGAAAPAAPPAARGPLTLAAVSPLSVRRPGKVLLDLRGSGMHDGLRARVLPLREAPNGISVIRQKCESDTLVKVLLDLGANVAPASYAIVLEDADGRQTKPIPFTVTR